ncbi:hypothetical protein AB0I60_12625 [Actinosynnema sp. NPDC050436]|uniref:hypothetical protein n=1 Tax=Actinosynnema sp. NPDC050436 TaxID=3155659 RepID=UPI0033FD1438
MSAPSRIEVGDVFSQDVVTATGIKVDRTSARPIAAFENRFLEGGRAYAEGRAHEALVITDLGGDRALMHVRRDPESPSNWSKTRLFKDHKPSEVVVISSGDNNGCYGIWVLFVASDKLYGARLADNGLSWGDPAEYGSAMSNLRTSTLAGQDMDGEVEAAAEAIFHDTATKRLTSVKVQSDGTLTSYVLDVPDGNGQAHMTAGLAASVVDGELKIYGARDWGDSGLAVAGREEEEEEAKPDKVLGAVTLIPDTHTFLVHYTDGRLRASAYRPNGAHVQSEWVVFPGSRHVRDVRVHMGGTAKDPLWDLYITGESNVLWVVRQHRTSFNASGLPNWLPAVPVDADIATHGVAAAMGGDTTAVFHTHTSGNGELSMEVQDAHSEQWREVHVAVHHTDVYEVTRHRVQATVLDGDGAPLSNTKVTLEVADHTHSACEITVQGRTTAIGRTPTEVCTDDMGRVTFTLPANGLAVPDLKMVAGTEPRVVHTIQPARAVFSYLSGQGVLNPTNPDGGLPKFDADGSTLRKLKPELKPDDAAVATKAIHEAAAHGLKKTKPGVLGVHIKMPLTQEGRSPERWSFRELRDADSFDRALADATAPGSWIGDLWNGAKRVAGDVARAVKKGVAAVTDTVIDFTNKTITLALQIGSELVNGITLAFKTLEHVAQYVTGVFKRIGAALKEALDWLKALFSFGDIWNTKTALQKAIVAFPGTVQDGLDRARTAADTWLGEQDAELAKGFKKLRDELKGKSVKNLRAQAVQHLAATATADDTHQNWLTDKVAAARPTMPDPTVPDGVEGPWKAMIKDLEKAMGDFRTSAKSLKDALGDLVEDPTKLRAHAVDELLTAVESFVKGLLATARGLLNGLFGVLKAMLTGVDTAFNKELDLGPLKAVWNWIAKAGGQQTEDKFTVAGFLCLLAAFPITIAYKLLNNNEQPFPNGELPFTTSKSGPASPGLDADKIVLIIAGLITIHWGLIGFFPIAMGADAPFGCVLVNAALGILIFIMVHFGHRWDKIPADHVTKMIVFAGPLIATINLVIVVAAAKYPGVAEVKSFLVPLLSTIGGAIALGLVAGYAIAGKLTGALPIATGVLNCFPGLFSFLKLPEIKSIPYVPAVSIAVDTLCRFIPGAFVVVDARK